MNQQPEPPEPFGWHRDRPVRDISDFNNNPPRPFRVTESGEAGAEGWVSVGEADPQGWVSVLSLYFSFSVCFQLSCEDLVSNYILYTDIFRIPKEMEKQ